MKALLSIVFLAWFFGVLFLINRAKANHCGVESGIIERPIVLDGKPIIEFQPYEQVPDTSIAFNYFRDSLKRKLQLSDKLKIVGHFTKSEAQIDRNIGLKRANAVRSLFEGYIDLNRIEIDSEIRSKIGTGPTFDISSDRYAGNRIDAPMPPMMADQPDLFEESTVVDPEEESSKAEIPVTTLSERKEEIAVDKNEQEGADVDLNAPDYIVYFNDASSEIIGAQEVQQYLDALSKRVKKSKEKIEIVGYDDNSRSDLESLELAKRRTWRVRKAFEDDYVRRKLVKVKNVGQPQPVESNATAEGRSKNRRVEIRILKK